VLTGRSPFRRANEVATVLAHLNDEPPSLLDVGDDLPPELDAAVRKALAKSPDERYASALELADSARHALGASDSAPARTARPPQLRTFLIADVRGYTSYTTEHGDEAGAALASSFARIAQDAVSAYGGRLVELRGDEALAAFESARKALQAAVELQRKVAEESLPRGVGVGLDAGEAVPVGRGFRGAALNTAARLCSRARPGEILATENVVHLAGAADGVAYGLRRPERLKGLERTVTAVEIHPAGERLGRQLMRRVSTRGRATSGRARAAAGTLLLALIAAVVALAVLLGGGGGETALAANTLGILSARTGKTDASIQPAPEIGGFINDARGFWGITAGGHVLQRIDGRTRALGRQIALPLSPAGFAQRVAFGAIWATDPHEPKLLRIDPRYGRIGQTIPLPPGKEGPGPPNAQGVAVTDDAVWVAYGYPKRIARYDPSSGDMISRQLRTGAFYDALVAAEGDTVWVVDREGRQLIRIDPRDASVAATGRLHPGFVEDARVAGGFLWVAMQSDGGVWQVDRNGDVVGKVPTGEVPYSLATGAGALWVANANSGTVTKIDPSSGRTRTYRTRHRPIAVGVTAGDVWVFVGLGEADARARVGGSNVVRAAAVGDPYTGIDPVTLTGVPSLVLNYVTHVRLMDYRPAKDGTAAVVPDLAAAPPQVREGGRLWIFRVRKGFRFSPPSGEPVTAEAVRYSIERAVSPQLSNPYCRDGLLFDIAGLRAYSEGKSPHVSGLIVRGDEVRVRLTAPSFTLPARLANPCFSIVPRGTPIAPDGLEEPIPSAGPYYVDYRLPHFQLVLKKNPNYAGSKPQRVDGVIVTESLNPARAAESVAQNKADELVAEDESGAPTLAPGGRYERRYGTEGRGQRFFRVPANGTRFLLFNTVAGPFANVRIRRAVALALDRRALAELAGGSPRGLFLSPGIPGYAARDVFGPRPEPARAKALLGGRRVRVLVLADAANPGNEPIMREIQRDLNRVGFDVRAHFDADPSAFAKRRRPRVDAFLTGWIADYPDASSFFGLLDPRLGGQYLTPLFRDERWIRRIRAVARLRGAERAAAYRRLDVGLARGPLPLTAFAVFGSPPQFFSARVRCRTFLGFFGGLVDPTSLCLRDA